MTDVPLKRSQILAIENVKRIADQLRSERNNAWAAAQTERERGDQLAKLLLEGKELVESKKPEKLDEWLKRVDEALRTSASP